MEVCLFKRLKDLLTFQLHRLILQIKTLIQQIMERISKQDFHLFSDT